MNRRRHPITRREALALGTGAFVLASIPFVRGRRRLFRRCLPVMGTLAEIAVVDDDARRAHDAIDAALAELVRVDRTMSRFRADSDVGRANLSASREAVPVSADTAIVLTAALRWAHATDGRFDPCLGRASEAWNPAQRRTPPANDAFRRIAAKRLYRRLDLADWRGSTAVRFAAPEVALDLGAIAKGHAVDLAVTALRERRIESAIVNAGGDLYAFGESEDGDAWRVGVRDPVDPDRLMETLAVRDAAVATSGDYERCFEYGGRLYHHLLDPATAAPRSTERHTATVIAETCLDADAAATAVFGLGRAAGQRLLSVASPGARIVGRAG